MKKFLLVLLTLMCCMMFYPKTAEAKVINSTKELPNTIQIQNDVLLHKVTTPTIKGYCGQKVKDLKLPSNGWYWIISNSTMNQRLTYGKTIYIKGVYAKPGTSLGQVVNVPVKVIHRLRCTKYRRPTSKKAGNYTFYTCTGCGTYLNAHKKTISKNSWIIPVIRSKTPVTMGKVVGASQLITDGKDAFIKITVSPKYKEYVSVIDGRKLIVSSIFKNGMPSEIPIKITMKDATKTSRKKEYTVRLKIEPDILIFKCSTNNGWYKYAFKYNFVGATKVKVREMKYNNATLNQILDEYVSKPKSDKDSYFHIATKKLNELGGSLTFKITVYYGNGKTITRTITE